MINTEVTFVFKTLKKKKKYCQTWSAECSLTMYASFRFVESVLGQNVSAGSFEGDRMRVNYDVRSTVSSVTAATKKIHYLLICLDLLSDIKQLIQSSCAHPFLVRDGLSAVRTAASLRGAVDHWARSTE